MRRAWISSSCHRVPGHIRCFSTAMPAMNRSYSDAIASLNTLQSNFAIVEAIRKSGRMKNEQAIPEMIEWCRKIGYEQPAFDRLNAIHVAGTKGKGSTAAFVSSILTQYLGEPDKTPEHKKLSKVGLYTSPHLRFVRERIQINGEPLSEDQFTKYFFETWDRLEEAAEKEGQDPKAASSKPVYFRYLTLMAFHTYLSEGVDTAIIECGIGGAYDSTNVLQNPAVTGITSLGIDHVGVLGSTLPEIAWHKAGIMKPGAKCFTPSSQQGSAKAVLQKVANEQKVELLYTDIDPRMRSGQIKLGLEADFQMTNASLAVAVASEWLSVNNYDVDDEKIVSGLQNTRWSGRCETRTENNIIWCIDGGHTLDSIEVAGRWFAGILDSRSKAQPQSTLPRFLIFNQQTRDADALAKALHTTLASALENQSPFTHAIFCTNTTYKETGYRPDLVSMNTSVADVEELRVQKQLAQTWATIDATTEVKVVKTIEEAVDMVRHTAGQHEMPEDRIVTLITGSLHLVGGFLEVLAGTDK